MVMARVALTHQATLTFQVTLTPKETLTQGVMIQVQVSRVETLEETRGQREGSCEGCSESEKVGASDLCPLTPGCPGCDTH